jgi:hypothetical protein
VAPADISGSVRAVVPLVGLPALHPQFIAGFILLLMARIVHTAAPKARKIKAIKRGVSLRWILAGDGIAMAAVTSVVATACVGTTLTSAVFVASTSSSANSFQARDGYYSTVISLSPQSYWRLGEASGASAVDTQGLLNGTYSGVTSYGTTAPLSHDSDTAVTCTSGTTCFTTADNAAFHNTGAQSIALWLKPSVAPQASNARVFAKYDGTNITYFVAYNGTSGQMRYIVDVNSRVTAISTTLLTNTNAWYFIAGTWDGSTARIYINGAQEGTAGGTGPVKQNAVGFTGMATTAGTPGAKGSLDDVAVWNRVLTPTEISTLYTRGTT